MEPQRDNKPVQEAESGPTDPDNETSREDHVASTETDEDQDVEDINGPAQQEQRIKEEYDPPLNPSWRAAFRNRETIFDTRPRFHHPSETLDEARKLHDAWCLERSVIAQAHKCLKREAGGVEYRGAAWVRKLRTSAEQHRDLWYRQYWKKMKESWDARDKAVREEEERAREMVVWEAELPFWGVDGDGDGGGAQQGVDGGGGGGSGGGAGADAVADHDEQGGTA